MYKNILLTLLGVVIVAFSVFSVKPSLYYLTVAKLQLSLTTGIDRQATYSKLRQTAYDMRGLALLSGASCEAQADNIVGMVMLQAPSKRFDMSNIGDRLSIVRNITIGTCLELQGK